jgi:Mg2+ and Co2+ transporter CorA
VSIEALLSRADGTDHEVQSDRLHAAVAEDELLWIDVVDASQAEVDTLHEALQLRDDVMEALRTERPALGARVLEAAVEAVVIALDGDQAPARLQVIVGDNFVITRHDGRLAFLDDHRARIQDQREVGRLSPAVFLAEVLNWQLDTFFTAADALEGEIDRLDEAALRSDRDLLGRLVRMRGRIASLRRVLTPQRDVYAELARPDFLPERHGTAATEIAALLDRHQRALEACANAREMLIGTFDVHMTRTAQRTNDVMRVLTLASVVLLPAVVIAGVMGMNFKVGFFDNPDSFWVVVGVMVVLAATTIILARWRRWL